MLGLSVFQIGLLVGGVVAAYFAQWRLRPVVWIVALLADHAVSVAYWDTGLPYPEAVAGLCDTTVCLLIYSFGRYRWENTVLYLLFQAMLLTNLLYLAGNLSILMAVDHDTYSSVLEALNILVLLTIGANKKLKEIGESDGSSDFFSLVLRRLASAAHEERKSPAFWATPRRSPEVRWTSSKL